MPQRRFQQSAAQGGGDEPAPDQGDSGAGEDEDDVHRPVAARWAHGEPRVYDTHLYRVGLDGQRFARLTEADGMHDVVFSPSRAFFLDSTSARRTRAP